MNNILKSIKSSMLAVLLLLGSSCEVFDLTPQDNPNALTPESADLELYMNAIQVSMGNWFDGTNATNSGLFGASDPGMQLTRMVHMFGPQYNNAYSPASFDNHWSTTYVLILKDIRSAIALATERELPNHAAIAKILESYIITTTVDMFGDVPYEEALAGADNLNPAVSDDATIYAQAEQLLIDAIELIDAGSPIVPVSDIYYGGNMNKWRKLANTLLMRKYLITRKVDNTAAAKFKAIVDQGESAFISSRADDFEFQWSSNLSNPDSRHPRFTLNYDNGGSEYMSNYFMNLLRTDFGVIDPRLRYYFYRQETTSSTNVNELPCFNFVKPTHYSATDPFCRLTSGYWGRDHGDASGIPPDGFKRTIWGVYPVGGKFDANDDAQGSQTSGGKGAGISPFLLNSFVLFMRAEAALTMATGENAQVLLNRGVTESLSKVLDFPGDIGYSFSTSESAQIPSQAQVDGYLAAVDGAYGAATSNEARLSVVMKEAYKAAYGNGIEVYNAYRRTGYPDNMQPTFSSSPGAFIRSIIYPGRLVDRNSMVQQKPDVEQRVFWDDGSITLK